MFLFVMLLSSFAVALRDARLLLPVLVSALVAAALTKAPVWQVLRRLRGVWAVLVFVAAMQALFSADIITGLLIGAAVLQRLVILMLGGTLLARYPGHVLVQAMLQLKLPYQLAFMVSIGLRFVPSFGESYRDSLNAMQLRGVDFKRIKLRARLKIYTWLLMPTIAAGVTNARRLAFAMELRGFGAQETRTSYAPLKMQKKDWLCFAGAIAWAALIVAGSFFIAFFAKFS